LWSSHNKVNERLSKEEASIGTGNPKFPKQLCSSCYLGHDQTYNKIEWSTRLRGIITGKHSFLSTRTAGTLGNEGTEGAAFEDLIVTTNAAVVPVGAASCAFGVFACY